MINNIRFTIMVHLIVLLFGINVAFSAPNGSIRGVVYDKDFDAPLLEAKVTIAETSETVLTSSEGNYLVSDMPPGNYTLVYTKNGYIRQVKADIIVNSGQMTDVDIWLEGDYTDMEEFVVQDIQLGGGSEAALLELRFDAPALMDSVGSELMKMAGVSDATDALKLVAGTTVQDGKYAVVRGLPDRYVNSQMNGIRLPTADANKRAVQLDQFPAAVIESIQVSKTFTPDQQGDASGGAVNVVLKGIPDETVINFSAGSGINTNVYGSDFLSYRGGGVSTFGSRDVDDPYQGDGDAVGVSVTDVPLDYKWSVSGGGKKLLNDEVTIGAFGSFYYEKDSSFYNDGIDDKYWVLEGENTMSPQYSGEDTPGDSPEGKRFFTKLFDVNKASEEVKWGALGILGLETENHKFTLVNMYTRAAEDKAVLAEDTRGKSYYFPGYNPNNPYSPGNLPDSTDAAPYIRTQTLEYTERTTHTIHLRGEHTFSESDFAFGDFLEFEEPKLDWTLSHNTAEMDQPDKRMFGVVWHGDQYQEAMPPYIDEAIIPSYYEQYKSAENINLGNLQRVWRSVSEESDQLSLNMKFPFKRWSESDGYLKFGYFYDKVDRDYNQDSYSNFRPIGSSYNPTYEGSWEDYWSDSFPGEDHPLIEAAIDVDYDGKQDIQAYYAMADFPITSKISVIGGARFESTELSIVNFPDAEPESGETFKQGKVTWLPPGQTYPAELNPGDADVDYSQDDVLPSLSFVFKPIDRFAIRTAYSETLARQTFKELAPIEQQEYLGADLFVGNPELRMSQIKNYDIRFDYTPFDKGLLSLSYFYKDVKDPIEYVQRVGDYSYTTATNYPDGILTGFEFEFRQDLGILLKSFDGIGLGANATIIDSEVSISKSEQFDSVSMDSRDMSHAPEHLYNIFMTYDFPNKATKCGLFYTVRGDTLVAGAAENEGNLIPNVYETEYDTLNFTLSHKFNDTWKLSFKAKNLLDPDIQTVYRNHITGEERVKTSYSKGMDFSLSVSATF